MELKSGLVSVIMSNYNTPEEYLRESIESILNQTYSHIEFIIVDDCSTDNSLNVIKSYKDDRIVLIENTENLGLTKSLNKALKQAKGEFVARMDADDISLPTRFEKQVAFLKQNSDVDAIKALVEETINEFPQSVIDFKNGKDRAVGFLVGQVMKKSRGKANPQIASKLVLEILKTK